MQDYQVVPNFRIRTIPVFGALPAIFGMACAAHVVTTLAGQGFDSEPVFRMQKKQYETQHERLRDREDARGSEVSCMGVDLEVGWFSRVVAWRGREPLEREKKQRCFVFFFLCARNEAPAPTCVNPCVRNRTRTCHFPSAFP